MTGLTVLAFDTVTLVYLAIGAVLVWIENNRRAGAGQPVMTPGVGAIMLAAWLPATIILAALWVAQRLGCRE